MSDNYQGLTRTARALESEIDEKLNDFSKLCKKRIQRLKYYGSPDTSLLKDDMILSESTEIKSLIEELGRVNDELEKLNLDLNFNEAQNHTQQMHRERFEYYRSEINKLLGNYRMEIEKEELFSTSYESYSPNANRRLDYQFKEKEHLLSSERMVDDQILIAIETRENLASQRHTMKRLQGRIHDVFKRFPLINSLVQRINLHKRRDSIIIGIVVFICTLLLLTYAFH